MGETTEQQNMKTKAMKVRFKMEEEDLAGALLVLVYPNGDLAASTFVIIPEKQSFDKADPEYGWQEFHSVCNEIAAEHSFKQSAEISTQIIESVDGYQLNQDILAEDIDVIDSSLRDIFEKALKSECSGCEILIEDADDFDADDLTVIKSEEVQELPEIEKDANLVLDATLVISPVRGKYIQDIVPGDLIKVVLLKKDEATKKVAKALKAINDEGDFFPIKGRVKQKFPNENGGTIIYCVIAKNILAKIIEEENIKAELFGQEVTLEQKKNGIPRIIVYAGLTAVLIIFIALVLLFRI